MKKYFSRGLFATFILATIFTFGTFINTTPVSADAATCQLIETLISSGFISSEKANDARVAAGCPVEPIITTYIFTKDLSVGSSGPDVTALQKILGVTATGYFGSYTKSAVINYQISKGIVPADGYVGAKTRELLNGTIVTPPIATTTSSVQVSFVSQSIIVEPATETSGSDRAVGTFKFKATAVGQDVYVNTSQNSNIIDILKSSVFVDSPKAVSLSGDADSYIDPSGSYYLIREGDSEIFALTYVINPTVGTGFYSARATHFMLKGGEKVYLKGFESEKVLLNSSITQIPPVASILGSKDLVLKYDSVGKEAQLVTSYAVSIAATGTDAYVPLNPFVVGVVNTTGVNNSVRSAKTVSALTSDFPIEIVTIDGIPYNLIPAGKVVNFSVSFSVNTSELFAGSYYAKLYGTWMPKYSKSLEIYPSNNASNKVIIIGEVSPYITSVVASSTYNGVLVNVKGVRLQNARNIKIINNTSSIWNVVNKSDGTNLQFMFKAIAGNYAVQVTDSVTGASNIVGFDVSTPISVQPVVNYVAGKAAGDGEIYVGEKIGIQGTNLVSVGGKDTIVYLNTVTGDKNTFYPEITQLGDSLIYATAPNNLTVGASYDLFVANGYGTSNPIRVKALGSVIIAPTANLWANGSKDLTVKAGDTINYTWLAENAVSASSNFTSNYPSTCLSSSNWYANSLKGSYNFTVSSKYEGCIWTFNYTAKNSNGETVTDTIKVTYPKITVVTPVIPTTPVVPSLTVISPNGGETWVKGQTYPIKWESTNISDNININLCKYYGSNNPGLVARLVQGVDVSKGQYDWTVPSTLTDATDYCIAIRSAATTALLDMSNGGFVISGTQTSANPENQNYATASASWDSILKLIQVLR